MIRSCCVVLVLGLGGCSAPALMAFGVAAGAVAQDVGAFGTAAQMMESLLPAKPQVCTAAPVGSVP